MTGIVRGLLAALLWGSSTVTGARPTRIVGALGLVLGERLSRRQLAGIAALLTGVALVAATR